MGTDQLLFAVGILAFLVAVAAGARYACHVYHTRRAGFAASATAGVGPRLAPLLLRANTTCVGGAPALAVGVVEAYATPTSGSPCGRSSFSDEAPLPLTPDAVGKLSSKLAADCGKAPRMFVVRASWSCPMTAPAATAAAAHPHEGFYWAQWGNVPTERENFSPDAPGACARRPSIAAKIENNALYVLAGN